MGRLTSKRSLSVSCQMRFTESSILLPKIDPSDLVQQLPSALVSGSPLHWSLPLSGPFPVFICRERFSLPPPKVLFCTRLNQNSPAPTLPTPCGLFPQLSSLLPPAQVELSLCSRFLQVTFRCWLIMTKMVITTEEGILPVYVLWSRQHVKHLTNLLFNPHSDSGRKLRHREVGSFSPWSQGWQWQS